MKSSVFLHFYCGSNESRLLFEIYAGKKFEKSILFASNNAFSHFFKISITFFTMSPEVYSRRYLSSFNCYELGRYEANI